MDADALNMQIRKFLKQVGVTSQRAIEQAVQAAIDEGRIAPGQSLHASMSLRIEAVDRAITLREIRVKFASGPDEVFIMRERVDPGKPYGPLDFKGGKTPIKSIVATYRSRFDLRKGLKSAFDGRPAVVQIWGQH